jgi:hypothetical protein
LILRARRFEPATSGNSRDAKAIARIRNFVAGELALSGLLLGCHALAFFKGAGLDVPYRGLLREIKTRTLHKNREECGTRGPGEKRAVRAGRGMKLERRERVAQSGQARSRIFPMVFCLCEPYSSPAGGAEYTAMHPVIDPQMPAPTVLTSPPIPTTDFGATCGTKISFRRESAATECEAEDCGMASTKKFVVPLTTPSTAPPCMAEEPV